MNAYAILAGGGVKGAALAGCLKAADDNEVHFKGYGGTSAGSIIALLAAAGYTPAELQRTVTDEIEFTRFLDDGGARLKELTELSAHIDFKSKLKTLGVLWKNRALLDALHSSFGLYETDKMRQFLLEKLRQKIDGLQNSDDVLENDLKKCSPLKIMISDIGRRTPAVWPLDMNGSVLDAVIASMSYPFVFKPVKMATRYLVDGGLCSNLPLSLFEEDRKQKRLPVVAFDLVVPAEPGTSTWSFGHFCGNMLSTALEAGDYLMRRTLQDAYYVPIRVPEGIETLDFGITKDQREALFYRGYAEAATFFQKNLPQWKQVRNQVEALQALHVPPSLVKPVLKAFADEVEANTGARDTRAHIMLPTPEDTRVIVYQYGMDTDPDLGLELALDAGRTGFAWMHRAPVIASIKESDDATVNMTQAQKNMVRRDRDALCSVPMFSPRCAGTTHIEDLEMIGLLSIDSSKSLAECQWLESKKEFIIDCAQRWADILSKLIS